MPGHRVTEKALAILVLLASPAPGEDRLQFNRDVRPILSEKCFFCHGPDASHREAELRLDIEADARERAVVPGQPDQSELYARITHDDPAQRMPPPDSGRELSAAEVSVLRRWIEQGAPYEGHWSFLPPQRAPAPAVRNEGWIRQPLDRFVLARLEAQSLAPAPEAERATWLRRVTLDLTGLLPSAAEVSAFEGDTSADAYERVVERLLRSAHYGEHMARYWLDSARYADTNGYQYDLEREQWVWRDWVIHAFNRNLPFDQFTIEQLAGDLLPEATDQQRLATAFHRNHPITIEGGVIDEEYRTEYVIDRVVTTATVWLGLTMTCARCHDHKYDPLSQREFYQFFAFFNNVPERGLNGFDPRLKVSSPLAAEETERLEQELAAATQDFTRRLAEEAAAISSRETQLAKELKERWSVVVPPDRRSQGGAEFVELPDQSLLVTGANPDTDVYELVVDITRPVHAIRLEALTHESFVEGGAGRAHNSNFVLSEFQLLVPESGGTRLKPVQLARADADYSQVNYPVSAAIDGKVDRGGWAVDGNTKRENRSAVFQLAEPISPEQAARVHILLHFAWGGNHQIGRFRVAFAATAPDDLPSELVALLSIEAAQRSPEQQLRLTEQLAARFGSPALQEAAARRERLRAARSELDNVPATMVMAEMPTPRTAHVLFRGEYDKPRDEVTPGTPAALPPLPEDYPRNRLGLARWLVSPSQPLTPRVTVNRFWQQLFGTGLVKTAEDFGSQGEWPSHPELLDWLARDFVDSGWDVKGLLRQLVLSATYRQSSHVTPESFARDPENRLLARGPRLRLDAEVIRDCALDAAGLLNARLGGPSVFPYQPAGLWEEINNRPGYSRSYPQDAGAKLYRRSLYTFWKRTLPPPAMAAFDAPEREFCLVRRSRTNTPLQALVLLHDPQFVEAARKLAERMLRDGGPTTEQKLTLGFRLCLARPPQPRELALLAELVENRRASYQAEGSAASRLLSVGESPTDPALDPVELAAWTTAGRVLLNLSEFVTKE